MESRGYTAKITFDDHAEIFHGRVQHLRDVITFESDSVEGLKREFRISIDDYLEFCEELGESPERPFSGRFVLRLDPELHRVAAIEADRGQLSLNSWVVAAIEGALPSQESGRRKGAA